MKQQINSVFEQIRLPAQASERIRAQLDMECSNLTEKGLDNMQAKKNIRIRKKVLAGVIAAAVICAVPAGVYAAWHGDIIQFISGAGRITHYEDNLPSDATQEEMEDYLSDILNQEMAQAESDVDASDSYLKVENGRLILDPDGEKLDITDKLSETEPYIYTTQPGDGTTHYLIIGGTLDNYGVAEYVRSEDGQWQGGFSNNAMGEWCVNGARQLELPWADMIAQNYQNYQNEQQSSGSESSPEA